MNHRMFATSSIAINTSHTIYVFVNAFVRGMQKNVNSWATMEIVNYTLIATGEVCY